MEDDRGIGRRNSRRWAKLPKLSKWLTAWEVCLSASHLLYVSILLFVYVSFGLSVYVPIYLPNLLQSNLYSTLA
jgi:hypothetical protein